MLLPGLFKKMMRFGENSKYLSFNLGPPLGQKPRDKSLDNGKNQRWNPWMKKIIFQEKFSDFDGNRLIRSRHLVFWVQEKSLVQNVVQIN